MSGDTNFKSGESEDESVSVSRREVLLAAASTSALAYVPSTLQAQNVSNFRIAFVSCMDAVRVPKQVIWDEISKLRPDALMLLGDQIYMDWGDLGESNWKTAILDDEKILKEFAAEMYRRYKLQWEVVNFQKLIIEVVNRKKDAANIFVTWDDHDFAWNNSMGGVPEKEVETTKHAVPLRVKEISRTLFLQFVDHLRAGKENPYPSMPDISAINSKEGVESFSSLAFSGGMLDIAMLDTRWYRGDRKFKGARILGPEGEGGQWSRLEKLFSDDKKGLLIIAAGTPLSFGYTVSDQAWKSKSKTPVDYAEYKELIDLAEKSNRPVLFVGGDIHRNLWGGEVSYSGGQKSKIIEVVSSGAAIGSIGIKKVLPRFGLIELVAGVGGSTDQLNIAFRVAQDKNGSKYTPDPVASDRVLGFREKNWAQATDWDRTKAIGGSESATLGYFSPNDLKPISMLVFRSRNKDKALDLSKPFELEEFDDLEGNFKQEISESSTPCRVQIVPMSKVQNEPRFGVKFDVLESSDKKIEALIREAFERARSTTPKTAVVLFVHGAASTLPIAIDHCYALRERFKCEPIGFAWPAGVGVDGFFASIKNAQAAYQNASKPDLRKEFEAALRIFNRIAKDYKAKGVPAILLLRSAGSVMFTASLMDEPGDVKKSTNSKRVKLFGNLSRIVLSSPLAASKDFARELLAKNAPVPPVFVTVNSSDATLKRASTMFPTLGRILGFDAGDQDNVKYEGVTFLNFKSAGTLHDYMLPELSEKQNRVHQALLSGDSFDAGALGLNAENTAPGRAKIYDVN
jgi:alkaline phosphatase D